MRRDTYENTHSGPDSGGAGGPAADRLRGRARGAGRVSGGRRRVRDPRRQQRFAGQAAAPDYGGCAASAAGRILPGGAVPSPEAEGPFCDAEDGKRRSFHLHEGAHAHGGPLPGAASGGEVPGGVPGEPAGGSAGENPGRCGGRHQHSADHRGAAAADQAVCDRLQRRGGQGRARSDRGHGRGRAGRRFQHRAAHGQAAFA